MTKKEARKRSLHFHILPSVHIAHMLRIARNDASYVTFIDVHDEYCHSKHIPREAPFAKILEKLRAHEETKPVGLLYTISGSRRHFLITVSP